MSNILKVKNKKEFLTVMIDMVVFLHSFPEHMLLRDREKEFLVNTIILSNEGYSLESGEMVKEICKEMKLKPDDVYNYRQILKKREWLTQTQDGFKLPLSLDFSKREIPESIDFKFTLKREK